MRGDVPAAWQENNSVLTLIFGFYFISLDNPFFLLLCKESTPRKQTLYMLCEGELY